MQMQDRGRQIDLYRFQEWNIDDSKVCSFNIDMKVTQHIDGD